MIWLHKATTEDKSLVEGQNPYQKTPAIKRTTHVPSAICILEFHVDGNQEEASANSVRCLRSRPRLMLWRQAMVSDRGRAEQ